MIEDIAKLTGSQGTGSLNADLLQKYLKDHDLQSKPQQPSAQSELLGKIFASLGEVIQDQPQQASGPLPGQPSDPEYLALKEKLADKARAAVRKAQALEASLDMNPKPDLSNIESLFSQFAKIFEELQGEMDKLRKKAEESKDKDVYKLKPTALHDEAPGTVSGDPGFSKKITTDVR